MSLLKAYTIFKTISAASVVIPIVCFIIKRKTLDRKLRVLFFFCIFSLLVEILSRLFADPFPQGYKLFRSVGIFPDVFVTRVSSYYSTNRLFLYYGLANIFTFVQFFAFSYFYYFELNTKTFRKIITSVSFMFLITTYIVWIQMRGFFGGENITTVFEAIFFFILSLCFFYKVLQQMNIPKLKEDSAIWINSAVLIYFAVSLTLFLADRYLATCPKNIFILLWSFNLLANLVFNVFIALAANVWKQKRLV